MTNSRVPVTRSRKRGGEHLEDAACEVAFDDSALSHRDTPTDSQIAVSDEATLVVEEVVDDREDLISLKFDTSGGVDNALFDAEKNYLANVDCDTTQEVFIDLKAPQMRAHDNDTEHLDALDQEWDMMNEAASCVDQAGVEQDIDTAVEIVESDVARENSYSDLDDNDDGASQNNDSVDFEEDKDE
eukprot:scaffold65296_cov46-Attheya_sp.AAC.1